MTPDDAKRLLAHAAAFDNRKPSLAAAIAWATALKDVPLDQDALDAIARYYGTPPRDPGDRLWIQPHDVRTHREAIRNARLENFHYEPPAGDSDPNYLQRLRGQLAAVASGAVPAPTTAPMLTGGPHPDVEHRLAGIGREIPAEKPRRAGPFSVECPKCSALVGRPCKTPGGKQRKPHPARYTTAGLPGAEAALDPEQARADEDRRRTAAQHHLDQAAS